MKLNWFSPLPPAKTGIANHTAGLLPTVAARAEVTFWTDQANWEPSLEMHATVRRYRPDQVPWAELNHGDITLYDIGNNPDFHSSIWLVAREHSGIVILHDLCLQHFFAGLFLVQRRDREAYVERMAHYYGPAGEQAARNFGRLGIEHLCSAYPLTPMAVENALGAIVHTRQGLEAMERAGCPAAYCPLPYRGTVRDGGGSDMPRQEGNRGDCPPYRLIVFGHIGFNRRLEGLFEALAQLDERSAFRLDVFGEVHDTGHFQKLVQNLGLSKIVTLHGFVDDEALETALRSAHLAINLRFPTMGEASASQLRIWSHALPTLVTPVGWYADIPGDVAAFVRPDREAPDIQSHLRAFLREPERFAEMGRKGRRHLAEQHTPEAYVEGILRLAAQTGTLHGRRQACYLIERIGAEMSTWLGSDEPDTFFRGPAEQIRSLAL